MAKEIITSCDICAGQPAETHTITSPDGTMVQVDLCEKHAAPIVKVMSAGHKVATQINGVTPRAAHSGPRALEAMVRGVPN